MKGNITGQTPSEVAMLKELQKVRGLEEDGSIGPASIVDIAVSQGVKDAWPVSATLYGYPVIIAKDITAFSPAGKSGTGNWKNSILGSFTYPRAKTPCSILMNNGKIICGDSCHSTIVVGSTTYHFPETVLYILEDGTVGVKRVTYASELPNGVRTAIGAMGLCDMYNPDAEGFKRLYSADRKTSKDYSDVLRATNHNFIGYKNGLFYLGYVYMLSGAQIQKLVTTKFKFQYALLLDGGGLASINGDSASHQIGVGIPQGYLIQAKKEA